MKTCLLILLSSSAFGLFSKIWSETANPDLLILNNGDTLHGTFSGLSKDQTISWSRKGWIEPAVFSPREISEIIVNKGHAQEAQSIESAIHLSNGDLIPGELISLNNKSATFNTTIAGPLTIPRKHLARVQPTLYQGQLIYRGPSDEKGWSTILPNELLPLEKEEGAEEEEEEPEGLLLNEIAADLAEPDLNAPLNQLLDPEIALKYEKENLEKHLEQEKETASWVYQSGAWHSHKARPLLTHFELPERSRIQFRLQWTGNLSLIIALNGQNPDTALLNPLNTHIPEKTAKIGKAAAIDDNTVDPFGEINGNANEDPDHQTFNYNHFPSTFRSCYLLRLNQTYTTLQRSYLDKEQRVKNESITNESAYFRPAQIGAIKVEIRIDRKSRLIALFVDGQFVTKWIDHSSLPIDGNTLAFLNQRNDSRVRLSRFLVTTWDGNMDSANSMDHPERDILLSTNGTDRYSGKVKEIKDGTVQLKNPYADLQIPLKSLLDLRLSKNNRSTDSGEDQKHRSTVHFYPFGHLQLDLQETQNGTLHARHPVIGDLQINTKQISTFSYNTRTFPSFHWNN